MRWQKLQGKANYHPERPNEPSQRQPGYPSYSHGRTSDATRVKPPSETIAVRKPQRRLRMRLHVRWFRQPQQRSRIWPFQAPAPPPSRKRRRSPIPRATGQVLHSSLLPLRPPPTKRAKPTTTGPADMTTTLANAPLTFLDVKSPPVSTSRRPPFGTCSPRATRTFHARSSTPPPGARVGSRLNRPTQTHTSCQPQLLHLLWDRGAARM